MKKNEKTTKKNEKTANKGKKSSSLGYEVWASDQSNSVPGQQSLGMKGSFLWIFDSDGVKKQLSGQDEAAALTCTPGKAYGPCEAFEIFPQELNQFGADGPTGNQLKDLPGFGRLHGVLLDPQNRYVNANFFAPGGGFIGIINVETKEAIALFRLSKFSTSNERSVHMSFWSLDGMAILCANLHGKAIERINVGRDSDGTITSVEFDRSATISFGTNISILEEAAFFQGTNAFGRPLIGDIVGDYSNAELGDLTPNGYCKEDGCDSSDRPPTGWVNNVPICTIPSSEDNLYVNFGGGGLLILDLKATPMSILGEYDSKTYNGASCGGVQVDQQMFMNAGVSAGASGFDQSTFTLYSFDDGAYSDGPNPPNNPPPKISFKDETNTNTIGNVDGRDTPNTSGQIAGKTTRRDAHGIISTVNGKYLHAFDRIQNTVDVFNVKTLERIKYDLTSIDGRSGRPVDPDETGPCLAKSVTDDIDLVLNDPSPDLLGISPDGKYIFVALLGPSPVSVTHSAQGSCPGVGIIQLTNKGMRGKLVDIIRTTNTIDTAPLPQIVGGIQYKGAERSDIHGTIVVPK